MGDVDINHQQVMATDPGNALVLYRPPVQGTALTDHIVIADDQLGRLVAILFILTSLADAGELKDLVVFADPGRSLDNHMGGNPAARFNHHIGTDQCPGANLNTVSDLGAGIDMGATINQDQTFLSAHKMVAELTSAPTK